MKTNMLINIFMILLMCKHETEGQRVLLTGISPLTIKQEKFVVQCQPDNGGDRFETVTSIEISRRIQGEMNFKPVVRVVQPDTIQWLDDTIRKRKSLSNGRAGIPSGAFIRYEIEGENTDCTDASQYKCYIITKTFNLSQTVTVFPEVQGSSDILMIASPSNAGRELNVNLPNDAFTTGNGTYTLGTSVWLTCSIDAGEPPIEVTWCFRMNGVSSFSRDGLVPYVQDENGENRQTSCFIQRTSGITYIVKPDDTRTEILCETQQQNTNRIRSCGNGVTSSVFTISVYQPPETTTNQAVVTTTESIIVEDESNFFAAQNNDNLHSVGLGLMVVGALLLVAVSVILAISLILFFKSKKIKKEAELQMIRSTYDSLADTTKAVNNTSTYAALRTGRGQHDANRPDSDGYATPSVLYHDIQNRQNT